MRRRGAFARRDKPILIGIEANWDAAAADEDNLRWARDLYAELSERSRDGAHLNFASFGEEGEELLRASFGKNYDQLEEVSPRRPARPRVDELVKIIEDLG